MNINPTSGSKHGRIPIIVLSSLLFLLPLTSGQVQATPDRYDPYAQPTFSPSMAIIIVILIAALFFMGFFSIYIRHCATSDAVRPLNGSQRHRRAAARGLDAAVIQTFPTLVYSEVKVLKIGKGALECAVCLFEFEDDETLRLIPKCDHVFHPECIDPWLASHTTCPVCRANLSQESAETNETTVVSPEELPSGSSESDIEAQNGPDQPDDADVDTHQQHGQAPEPQVIIDLSSRTLNRNRTRGSSRSNRPRKFSRSHSTGHSLVQPGENTERFTLRLPVDVRKEIMNRELNRANSLVVLRRESSSRRGYRTVGDGSSRGKSSRWLERLDRSFKSDRWVFKGSFSSRVSSLRSPKVAARNELPAQPVGPESSVAEPGRPPV